MFCVSSVVFLLQVNTGNIGHLYKIRIGHTNTGNSPAWHCEEVKAVRKNFIFPKAVTMTVESKDESEKNPWDNYIGLIKCLQLHLRHYL